GAMMSDRRLKSNIVRLGDHPLGIGWYEYDIDGRREQGVMAQELRRVKPEAVVILPNGYLAVRYDLIGGRHAVSTR
ncbi:MAG: tail fiber domain-containing protein, partial [Cetobacterium sp.]